MNPTEKYVSTINTSVFFREFTFSTNKFKEDNDSELELADNVVWLDDIFLIFQIKDRNRANDGNEVKWFENKVIKKGVRQIKNTIEYLAKNKRIPIKNDKGHELNLSDAPYLQAKKIIVYTPSDSLPESKRFQKFYESKTEGLIHLFHSEDYLWVCQYLITPKEIEEYLSFREQLFNVDRLLLNNFPEQYVLGHFLSGENVNNINPAHVEILNHFKGDIDEFHLPKLIENFTRGLRLFNQETDYYFIIKEIAKLKRYELREIKIRLQKTMDDCRKEGRHIPYRLAIPRTNCGFVFIPLHKEFREHWKTAIENFTIAHKYDQKLNKCIGVLLMELPDDTKEFDTYWLYAEYEWKYEKQIEDKLADNFPFRKVKLRELGGYRVE